MKYTNFISSKVLVKANRLLWDLHNFPIMKYSPDCLQTLLRLDYLCNAVTLQLDDTRQAQLSTAKHCHHLQHTVVK